ncbi:MAG: alpha/beta fold hydrolase [Cytophagales bacterium]|nr:MAG: alpha/beta fold hydrolase [Cytophagales bacterium]TAF60269.1 MAG: alpha/beta fold hydrolase [Cytophagales bacterium]
MPLITHHASPFVASWPPDGHLQTILPSTKRKVVQDATQIQTKRERLFTPDNDFLDLDWYRHRTDSNTRPLLVVLHGLEGSSQRHYVQGLVKLFTKNNWDALGYNCRSCSGELNQQARFYHHADSADLHCVLDYVCAQTNYKHIFLAGFSMGGNIAAKYLAEKEQHFPAQIIGAMGVSCPFWLEDCALALETAPNMLYNKKFVKSIVQKALQKKQMMPERFLVSSEALQAAKTCRDVDKLITVPYGGFKSPQDFYAQGSMGTHIARVKVPFLLLQALNDPFLPLSCYPQELAQKSDRFFLEICPQGGHVGFMVKNEEESYAETRALRFAEACLHNDFTHFQNTAPILHPRKPFSAMNVLLTLKQWLG